MIIILKCGHVLERSGQFFQPTELCPIGDGWQDVTESEMRRIEETVTETSITVTDTSPAGMVTETSLSETVTNVLKSVKPIPLSNT